MRIELKNTDGKFMKVVHVAMTEVNAAMWALAQIYPDYTAVCWLPHAVEAIENSRLIGRDKGPGPGMSTTPEEVARMVQKLRPSTAMVEIDDIVTEGLNTVYNKLRGYAEQPDFAVMVALAAEGYAKEYWGHG